MKRFIIGFSFLFAMTLSGCYGLGLMWNPGPKPKIYDDIELRKVNRVCILPVSVIIDEAHKTNSRPLTDSVWNKLRDEKVFSLVPIDSFVVMSKTIPNSDTTGFQKLAQKIHADAYLRIAITYSHSLGPAKEPSAQCWMVLYDAATGRMLMDCVFDTYSGKNYWGPPKLEQVTRDAINGAVETLSETIRDEQKLTSK